MPETPMAPPPNTDATTQPMPPSVPPPDTAAPPPSPQPTVAPGGTAPESTTQPPLPKGTFMQGFTSGGQGTRYVVDKNGNTVPAPASYQPTKKSVFGSILAGAALGALTGAGASQRGGGGFGPGEERSQQFFQNRDVQQKKEAVQAKAMSREDAQFAAQMAQISLNTAKMTREAKWAEEDRPFEVALKNAGLQMEVAKINNLSSAMLKDHLEVVKTLKDLGVGDPEVIVDSYQQAMPYSSRLATGQLVAIPTPDGKAAELHSPDIMRQKLSKDVTIPSYSVDPKTGELITQKRTLKAGEYTVGEYLGASVSAQGDLEKIRATQVQKSAEELKQAQIESTKAEAKEREAGAVEKRASAAEHMAKTEMTKEQTEQIKNFGGVIPDNAATPTGAIKLTSSQLGKALLDQGMKLPQNFDTLYAVGHYDLAPATFSSRPYNRPGMPPQMGRDAAFNFIRKFVNPEYDENRFTAIKDIEKSFAAGKDAQALGSFNAATGHLGQLYYAAMAMHNGNFPAIEKIANEVSTQIGRPVKPSFDAIKGVLVGEAGRLMKNAAPDVNEMAEISKTLDAASSPDQFKGVAEQYAHAMYTKGLENVNRYVAWTGKMPPYSVSPQAKTVYDRMGIDVSGMLGAQPGGGGSSVPSKKPMVLPPGVPPGSIQMAVPGHAPMWIAPDKQAAARALGANEVP